MTLYDDKDEIDAYLQPMSEKERADRLERMVDRLADTVAILRAFVIEGTGLMTDLWNKHLPTREDRYKEIGELLGDYIRRANVEIYGEKGGRTLRAVDKAGICRVDRHVFIDGVCAQCGTTSASLTTNA